jgi:hypothetical protein
MSNERPKPAYEFAGFSDRHILKAEEEPQSESAGFPESKEPTEEAHAEA